MKTRTGFISNSSSSSFITAWPRKPETVDEMSKLLFGDVKEYPNPYPWEGHPDCFPVSSASEWLMKSLNWDGEEVRDRLIDDLESNVSYLLSTLAEKYRNSYSFEGGKMVSCLSLAKREIKKLVSPLEKRFPRVNWAARIKAVVDYRAKWHKIGEAGQKELWKLQEELRKEHGCQKLPWQDAAKMTAKQKAAYEKACDKNYKQFQAKVLEDPRYKAADDKQKKVYHRQWHEPKKSKETLKLIASRLADIFYADNNGSEFSVVEIHDDSDFGSAMEHGDLFSRLPHKKFSHH